MLSTAAPALAIFAPRSLESCVPDLGEEDSERIKGCGVLLDRPFSSSLSFLSFGLRGVWRG